MAGILYFFKEKYIKVTKALKPKSSSTQHLRIISIFKTVSFWKHFIFKKTELFWESYTSRKFSDSSIFVESDKGFGKKKDILFATVGQEIEKNCFLAKVELHP